MKNFKITEFHSVALWEKNAALFNVFLIFKDIF